MSKKEIHIGDGDRVKIERPFPWGLVIVIVVALLVVGGIAYAAITATFGKWNPTGSTATTNGTVTPPATPLAAVAPILNPTPTPTPTLSAPTTPAPTPIPTPTLTPAPTLAPTPTPMPTPPLTPMPVIAPSPMAVLLEDDFVDNRNRWWVGEDEIAKAYLENGSYHLVGKANPRNLVRTSYMLGVTLRDFVFEAEMEKIEGPDNMSYGLVFRYVKDKGSYRLLVSGNGQYTISKQLGDNLLAIVPWTKSPHIRTGNQHNKLMVVARGSTFELYVNGQHLGTFSDEAHYNGSVGFQTSQGVHIAIGHIKVSSAPGMPTPVQPTPARAATP